MHSSFCEAAGTLPEVRPTRAQTICASWLGRRASYGRGESPGEVLRNWCCVVVPVPGMEGRPPQHGEGRPRPSARAGGWWQPSRGPNPAWASGAAPPLGHGHRREAADGGPTPGSGTPVTPERGYSSATPSSRSPEGYATVSPEGRRRRQILDRHQVRGGSLGSEGGALTSASSGSKVSGARGGNRGIVSPTGHRDDLWTGGVTPWFTLHRAPFVCLA